MLELIHPASNESIADLYLVIEEREREFGIKGFDPKRYTSKLNGERIDVHPENTAFDDMTTQQRLYSFSELFPTVGIVRWKRNCVVRILTRNWRAERQSDSASGMSPNCGNLFDLRTSDT